MEKLLSGRFWLAIMAGAALLLMCFQPDPPIEAIFTIIGVVFTSYFNKRAEG